MRIGEQHWPKRDSSTLTRNCSDTSPRCQIETNIAHMVPTSDSDDLPAVREIGAVDKVLDSPFIPVQL